MRALRTPFMEATDAMVDRFRGRTLEELRRLAKRVRREEPLPWPVEDCQTIEGRIVKILGAVAVDGVGLLRARPRRDMSAVDALFFTAALIDCAEGLTRRGNGHVFFAAPGEELTVVRCLSPHEELAAWLHSSVWDRWESELI